MKLLYLFCFVHFSYINNPNATGGKSMYLSSGRSRLEKREKHMDIVWKRHRRLRNVKQLTANYAEAASQQVFKVITPFKSSLLIPV